MSVKKAPQRNAFARMVEAPEVNDKQQEGSELEGAREMPLALLVPNTYFLRDELEGDVDQLAQSITSEGLHQPLVVRLLPDNERYEVVAGNQRLRALRQLGWTTAPAIIRELDDRQAAIATASENFQRQNLTPKEEYRLYRYLMQLWGVKEYGAGTELAALLNRDHERVSRVLALGKHPDLLDATSDPDKHKRMTFKQAIVELTKRRKEKRQRRAQSDSLPVNDDEVSHGAKLPDPATQLTTLQHVAGYTRSVPAKAWQPLYNMRRDIEKIWKQEPARLLNGMPVQDVEALRVEALQAREQLDRLIDALGSSETEE